ncbi:hypothetical protein ABZ865_16960 [Streptomyces sp. NPDC047085]|uniref:hypothetical protein n=1 Tax=Streptomyces sp. NPDC047085 TaxID=3155140 RepID=UPI0033C4D069
MQWTDETRHGAAYGEDPYGGVGYTYAYGHEYGHAHGYAYGHEYGHAASHGYGGGAGHGYGEGVGSGYGGGTITDTAPPPWGSAHGDVLTAQLPVIDTPGGFVPDPDAPEGESVRPVFVDSSGRRQRHVLRAARLLVIPAAGYVGVLISALLGGPSISSPFVPQAGSTHPATPRATAPDSPSGTGHSARSATSTAPHKSSGTAAGNTSSSPTGRSTTDSTAPAPTATSQPTAAPTTTAAPGSRGRAVGSSHKPVK